MSSEHILVVDDDPRIRSLLRRYLTAEGYRVSEAGDGAAMRRLLNAGDVNLVLLDLVLPDEDGIALARWIRSTSNVAIIMLTGKGKMIDRVIGLEVGADDYIAKPFHLREVLARIKSVLRRCEPSPTSEFGAAMPDDASVLTFDGWRLDQSRRQLSDPAGRPIDLSTGEFDLLCAFARHPNRVLSRDRLLDICKNRSWSPYDRSIDTQVGRLRGKIERDRRRPELIKTVRGSGYMFVAKVQIGN